MSKVLRTISKIASIALPIAALAFGPIGAAIAGGIAAVTGTLAQITAPKPVARGSVTNVIIDTEPPRPYMIGESYSAGVLRHRVGYGPTQKKVPNPYLWEVKVFSGVGPVDGLVQEQFDYGAIGSYYSGFYSSVSQLGLRPQVSALVPPLNAPATGWGANHRLSGCAAIGGNYLFDKDGKVFASGVPVHGAIWRGEKVYDPRLDSTYPGGSGACRLGVENTYVYSASPPLHVGTYAFGRYQNGIKIFGLGLAADGIDWAAIVDWANDCDTNGWTAHGTIYEGGRGADLRGQRVQNLDDICAAGGGRWLVAGALLSFDWHRPRVPLATLTDDDLLEEGGSATAVQSLRERMNGVRPQYTSPAHNYEQITADEIVGSTYRAEDGTPLTQTWTLNLVKDPVQAGELATYALADSREIGPIDLAAKVHWRFYKPGETITVNSELLGYNGPAVILQRDFNPQSLAVNLSLKSETAAKHPFALGQVANPPPTPIVGQTQQERDGVAAETTANPSAIVFADISPFDIQANRFGVTTTSLPITRQLVLTSNEVDVTGTAAWSIVRQSAGLSATVSAAGVLSLNTANAGGSITVRGVLAGINHERIAIVTRTVANGTAGGGSGSATFTDNDWVPSAGGGFAPVTDLGAIIASSAAGQIQFMASASYYGDGTATIKAQYSADDVTWFDAGAEVTGDPPEFGFPGFVSLSVTATGLAASTDYFVRLVARDDAATSGIDWVSPTFTARQP